MGLDDDVVAVSRGIGSKAKDGNRSALEVDLAELERLRDAGASIELVGPLITAIKTFLSKPAKTAAAAAGRRGKTRRVRKSRRGRSLRR